MIHPRPLLALLAVAVLSLGWLNHPWCLYTPITFAAAIISLGIAVAACTVRDRAWPAWRDMISDESVTALTASILTIAALLSMMLIYDEDINTRFDLWLACWFGSVATGLLGAPVI